MFVRLPLGPFQFRMRKILPFFCCRFWGFELLLQPLLCSQMLPEPPIGPPYGKLVIGDHVSCKWRKWERIWPFISWPCADNPGLQFAAVGNFMLHALLALSSPAFANTITTEKVTYLSNLGRREVKTTQLVSRPTLFVILIVQQIGIGRLIQVSCTHFIYSLLPNRTKQQSREHPKIGTYLSNLRCGFFPVRVIVQTLTFETWSRR